MLSGQQLIEEFDSVIPYLFLKGAYERIQKCHQESFESRNDTGLRIEMAKWHQPYLCRAMIQNEVYEFAQSFPSIEASFKKTSDGNNDYVLIKGGNFQITVSKVDSPGVLPRGACFRSRSSRTNYSLFKDDGNETDPVYAILSYTPDARGRTAQHVRVIFPDSEYERVLHYIDLGDRYFASDPHAEQTKATGTPEPVLRLKPGKNNEAQR